MDATQKLKTLSAKNEFHGELGDTTIHISVDTDNKTLTVTDRGIGMTAEEIDRYINQIAFSGAEEFLAKYKDQAIIGHFGLGFYSSFMVADKVDIYTQSYKADEPSMHWTCDGSPEYEMEELTEKRERGTSIVLHLSDDCKEYCEESKVEELLKKYCHFLPVPIAFGKVKEWKDGKYVDTEKDNTVFNFVNFKCFGASEMTEYLSVFVCYCYFHDFISSYLFVLLFIDFVMYHLFNAMLPYCKRYAKRLNYFEKK